MEQVERMIKKSRIKLSSIQKGDNAAISIPLVDRGRGDPQNILAMILNKKVKIIITNLLPSIEILMVSKVD